MKIVAINGSYRGDNGHTRFLIDRLFKGASAAGATCEVVTLAALTIHHCLACGRCHTEKSYLRCVHDDKDDVRGVFHKMSEADLIIYATPVYVFGISGLLKTFMDRMYATGDIFDLRLSERGLLFHHIDHTICSKPFVTIVCCDNLEAETPRNVLGYFRTYSRFMDAPQVGVLIRNGGRLSGYGHDSDLEKTVPKIFEVYAAYEQAGHELATEGRIRRTTQLRANQEIVPAPLFGIMKRLPCRPLKKKIVAQAQKIQGLSTR